MSDRVRIDQLAAAVMEGLTEYADLAADELKKGSKESGEFREEGYPGGSAEGHGRLCEELVCEECEGNFQLH